MEQNKSAFVVREVGNGLSDKAKGIATAFLLSIGAVVVSAAPAQAYPLTVVPDVYSPHVILNAEEMRLGNQIIDDMTKAEQQRTGRSVCISFKEMNVAEQEEATRGPVNLDDPSVVVNGFKVGPTSCSGLEVNFRTDVVVPRHAAEIVAYLIQQDNQLRESRTASPPAPR